MNILSCIQAMLLYKKDWWQLHQNRINLPPNNKYDIAMKMQLKYKFFGSYIGQTAKFASKPVFPHGMSEVFISGGVNIGKNCVIFQQVTIGSNTIINSKTYGAPTIGDNCYIGAGAKIIGRVHVGNNCRIGANAVVTKDVPDNTVVVMSTMRYINHDEPLDNRYVSMDASGNLVYYDNGEWKKLND